jgi:hypothetical protein
MSRSRSLLLTSGVLAGAVTLLLCIAMLTGCDREIGTGNEVGDPTTPWSSGLNPDGDNSFPNGCDEIAVCPDLFLD